MREAPQHSCASQIVRFADFEVDLRGRELRRNGARIPLQEQPLQVLAVLLKHAGEVVTREELCQHLWPSDTFVDFDNSLNTAINKIREALGDSTGDPHFVETLPRRGYRFIAPLREGVEPQPSEKATQARPAFQPSSPDQPEIRRAILLGLALAVALLLSFLFWKPGWRAAPNPIVSLAVLPLENLSRDSDQDYFADGMTDALTTDLGKISALRVISRTSVMQYKGTKKPLQEIARELKVDAILEGTVARSGNRVRVTANLVQTFPERHLWAESYDSEIGDVLTVQATVAQAIAHEIQVKLTPQERKMLAGARRVNSEAFDLCLRGSYAIATGTAEALEQAVAYFQRAIQEDPTYAPAYTGLAFSYATWVPGRAPLRALMPKAKQAALKAIELDDTLAGAHTALAFVELTYDWNWTGAEKEYKRAIELNPNYAAAHARYAYELVVLGRTEEALVEARRAVEIEPFSFYTDYPVWVFILARRYDLALERTLETVQARPNWVWGHYALAQIYEQTGKTDDAVQEFLKVDELFGTDPEWIGPLKEAFARSGARGYWIRTLERYRKSAKSRYVSPGMVAAVCARVGDKQCAFEWLEKGFEERDDLLINLKVEPIFDRLHSDPRFQDMVRRVGLPQ
jgi:TolB-like protein/DNA-binding winged helix-turn-helix (wHTH) protein/Tfp pilus assembly protein PilF